MSESDDWDDVPEQRERSLRWQIIGDFPLPGDHSTFAEHKDDFLKWLGPLHLVKDDILSGIGVTLTLVPEAIAFAIIAKVPPISGLYATFFMCLICGVLGGRPGMISGATGAIAVVQGQLVSEVKGNLDYLYVTMITVGIIQFLFGTFRLAKLMNFVSKPTVLGFLNGLAIVILLSQMHAFREPETSKGKSVDEIFGVNSSLYSISPFSFSNITASSNGGVSVTDVFTDSKNELFHLEFSGLPGTNSTFQEDVVTTISEIVNITSSRVEMEVSRYGNHYFGVVDFLEAEEAPYVSGARLAWMLVIVFLTVIITLGFPHLTVAVPSMLIAISFGMFMEYAFHLGTITVGDHSEFSGELPKFHTPNIPFTLDSMAIIFRYSVIIAAIGILQTLMTLQVVNNMTNTHGQPNRELVSQGIGNLVCALFGSMGGCAMIGQSVMNIQSRGRGRLSALVSATLLFITIIALHVVVTKIPVGTLVGVMFVVVIHTFDWASLWLVLSSVRYWTFISVTNAIVIIIVTVVTVFTNLAIAVCCGVVFEALCFVWESGAKLNIRRKKSLLDKDRRRTMTEYTAEGSLFFGSARSFQSQFDPLTDGNDVVLNLDRTRTVDISALDALNELALRYSRLGKQLHLVKAKKKTEMMIAALKRDAPHIHLAVEFDKIPSNSYCIDYHPEKKPDLKPFVQRKLIEKYFGSEKYNFCGGEGRCQGKVCEFFNETVTQSALKYEDSWRDAMQIGRVVFHPEWLINICEWNDLNSFDFTELSPNRAGEEGTRMGEGEISIQNAPILIGLKALREKDIQLVNDLILGRVKLGPTLIELLVNEDVCSKERESHKRKIRLKQKEKFERWQRSY
eukprot:TRINITY_DN3892_c0_g1_i1.p1 TRINITY_DN3892_c0_g1~~TRINITY_DN3892_c0_g1_i1.p1  ORF type:complete len:902 (+),score=139.97 TRINITY_DN3892_c0_g1_i1:162-2708(+)